MRKVLVTGSSGLIGSACVSHFDAIGWEVHGVDNNQRRDLFGAEGDTSWNLARLRHGTRHFHHHDMDIRHRPAVLELLATLTPDFVIHCAAQPSHDLAASRPFDDFDINATGTLNLLEAVRQSAPEAVFAHLSTNKVYGDAPNEIPMRELPTRWEYDDPAYANGIDETMRIDRSKHSLFGASKLAADILVQEYGRYFGMKTACFRGGCLTGPAHAAVELHGFLAYLIACCRDGRPYTVFGYQGKQVRDNIHAVDVARVFEAFYENPRCGEVYNLGGGRANSVSVLEAIARAEAATGKKLAYTIIDTPRAGDHRCYITNLAKICRDFPGWSVTKSLDDIFSEIAAQKPR